ncbi:MAG TPA: capsule assembly Wzi family protein [Nevskiaceae bacterium]|nr:capsule assembly Wzi family protein [Nevskiaceae bacterium]
MHKRESQCGWRVLLFASILWFPFRSSAATTPWLDVGNAGLRSDVELLASYGLVVGPITTWPIPARQILRGLADQKKLEAAPPAVQSAAERVLAELSHHEGDAGDALHPLAAFRTTNQPSLVRPFGDRARDEVDARAGGDYDNDVFSARLLVGDQGQYNGVHQRFSLDGSYLGARVGNLQFYGGWLDQWYGPGEVSSLILSNNARPFPKIGVMRADPLPFQTRWLSWLGPWQANFFVGLLDGNRIDRDTDFVSLRFDFEPVSGFEVGLMRETEICGYHHPCGVGEYFQLQNTNAHPDKTSNEAGIDFKYTRRVAGVSVSPYVQFMDSDDGPFVHAVTSYLAGATASAPMGGNGA